MGRLLILLIESRPKAYRTENSQDVFSPKYDDRKIKCATTVLIVVFGGRVPVRVDVRRRSRRGRTEGAALYPSNLPKMGRLLILLIESRPKAYRAENSQDVFSPKYDDEIDGQMRDP